MDQLYHEMHYKRVFNHYNEGIIRFRPTYKYDPGTDNWDSSEKNRAPAWCDRVLWKGERIDQLTYESVMRLQLSDHKPVYAIFLCGVSTATAINLGVLLKIVLFLFIRLKQRMNRSTKESMRTFSKELINTRTTINLKSLSSKRTLILD